MYRSLTLTYRIIEPGKAYVVYRSAELIALVDDATHLRFGIGQASLITVTNMETQVVDDDNDDVPHKVEVTPQVRRNARSYDLRIGKSYGKGNRVRFTFTADYSCDPRQPPQSLWQWESGYLVRCLTMKVIFPSKPPAVRYEIQDTTPSILADEDHVPSGSDSFEVQKVVHWPAQNLTYALSW